MLSRTAALHLAFKPLDRPCVTYPCRVRGSGRERGAVVAFANERGLKMVKHFGIGTGAVACGRVAGRISVVSHGEVTCKSCQATSAYRSVTAAVPVVPAKAVAFEEWRRKLDGNDRLPRGRFFSRQRGGLTAYQVGDGDVVAAYTPSGAIAVLCAQTGDGLDAYCLDDVEVVDARRLDAKKYFDTEIGRTVRSQTSLRQDLRALGKPTYLYGWGY